MTQFVMPLVKPAGDFDRSEGHEDRVLRGPVPIRPARCRWAGRSRAAGAAILPWCRCGQYGGPGPVTGPS